LWERTREGQAARIVRLPGRTRDDLATVTAADLGRAAALLAAAEAPA
jgi:hypothetical protein